ncbi:MAG: hypothetical protein WCC45_00305 [Paeniglutamicibacter sp.]
MRSGIDFSENYLGPAAGVRKLEEAIGWAASNAPGPTGMFPFLRTLERKTAHDGVFEYRSCETDMLGWIGEAAAGTPMDALVWAESEPNRTPPWVSTSSAPGSSAGESTLRCATLPVSGRCSWATGFT